MCNSIYPSPRARQDVQVIKWPRFSCQIPRHQQWHDARLGFLTKEEGMSDDRTKADKAWEERREAARYRIFNAETNAVVATAAADDGRYFSTLDQADNS